MQYKQTLLRIALVFIPIAGYSQTTYTFQDDKTQTLLERLEIKAGYDSALNYSKTKPYSRKQFVPSVESYWREGGLNKIDQYNAERVLMNNSEWTTEQFASKKPILKHFYTSPANLYEVHTNDFDLVINPALSLFYSNETDNGAKLFTNTRGISLRGRIANKVGFYSFLGENQERTPGYVNEWVNERKAVPGQGFYKPFKGDAYDYFEARGGVTFNAAKYIDISFAYDKNFIGNGQRSLFLSDFGNNYLFLKLNTKIWKFNYQNIFMELQAESKMNGGDRLLPKKYAVAHHLDINLTKWLNVGLYESVVFGRKNRFDFSYLNPVIFYRAIEQHNGSPDNAMVGLDFKANFAKQFQVYGQLLLDEFKLSEVKANKGWWGNKVGYQIGAKYIDAFTINNLDLQLEYNRVRPFTYTHKDSVSNFTHYNQPLAHPLGANFSEVIAQARYQPAPKWQVLGKLMYYQQGRDSSLVSYGSNVLKPYTFRNSDYGYSIGSGLKTDVMLASLLVSYELRENLFLELYGQYRNQKAAALPASDKSSKLVSVGLRWNMYRRLFEF